MLKEEAFFLTCLSDLCHGRKTVPPKDNIDFDLLLQLSRAHSLASIVYIQCMPWIEGVRKGRQFIEAFQGDVFFSVNRQVMFKELVRLFAEGGISFICMKGGVFREKWPVPELRSMGDIDLIIHPSDREKADQIMTAELGCSKMVDNHDVWSYFYDKIEFEIHTHMFYEYLANRYDYRSYFDHVWDHVCQESVFGVSSEKLYIPENDYHFLYFMVHTAKHIINNGAGLRTYLDMFFLSRQFGQSDWERLSQQLEALQLLDFTKVCFALCEKWFHVEMPFADKNISDVFLKKTTEKVMKDGTFGLTNPQNAAAHSAKELERSRHTYLPAAIKLTVNILFPSYRNMQLIPRYAWVDGKPWLLPAAWIYRWGYCLTHKFGKGMDVLTEPFLKKRMIDQRRKELHEWGL